jgi:hypothetical protein
MLSPLQREVARIVALLPEGEGFALAGGAALIARGIVDRGTRDLDFFSTVPDDVDRVLPVLEAALVDAGLEVERRQVAPGFARLIVRRGTDRTEVDLGSDARLLPAEDTPDGVLLASEELAIDKVLALFGRAEARDFVDVFALERTFALDGILQLAAQKDPGFDRNVLREMLGRFRRLPRDEFELGDRAFADLGAAVERWVRDLTPAVDSSGLADEQGIARGE